MNRALFALLLLPGAARAGGFALAEQDAAATGRSGAAIAQDASASAIHYNPAGLAGIHGVAASVGATALVPGASAVDPATGAHDSAATQFSLPPHLYAAYGGGKLTGGLGFNVPFGGGLKWPDDWRGRYELTEMRLQVFAFHAAASYSVTPALSLGAAATLYRGTVFLSQRADFVDSDATALLGASGYGIGASFGARYTFSDRFQLGVVGKLPVSMPLSGRAHFENVPAAFSAVLPDQAIRSHVTLPGSIGLGAEVGLGRVRLYGDAQATFWSAFKSFDIDFENEATPDVSQARNWRAAGTFRLGAEVASGWLGPHGVLRAGALFDMAASPADTLSPSLPDSGRLGLTLGVGRDLGPVRGDLAYAFIAFLPRDSTGEALPASYSARAHLLTFTVAFRQL